MVRVWSGNGWRENDLERNLGIHFLRLEDIEEAAVDAGSGSTAGSSAELRAVLISFRNSDLPLFANFR
jgi:hypothetical protein